MNENYKNQIIKSLKDFNLRQAETRVRQFLKIDGTFLNGYIYVDCPTISDLFVVKGGTARKCTGDEWVNYYRGYLFPNPQ